MPLVLNGTTGVQDNSGAFVAGTAVASTSGTSIDFTGIPSWAKRITVMFTGVSTNGTSSIIVQAGSTSFTTSGYTGTLATTISGATATSSLSTGFQVAGSVAVASTLFGKCEICLLTGNTWAASAVVGRGNEARCDYMGGTIALSGVLDRVRITTVNGTDTFDAGSINILYE
jgi:hypothetical protein